MSKDGMEQWGQQGHRVFFLRVEVLKGLRHRGGVT